MVIAGAKLAMGSWKIMDTAPPLTISMSLAFFRDRMSTEPLSRFSVILLPGS